MRRSRFSEGQILGILKEHEAGGRRLICAGSTGSAIRHSTTGRPSMAA
jgi:hypothetical protein